MTDVLIIDTLNISDASKTIYKNALNKHLRGVNLDDYDAVAEVLESKTKPTKLVLLSAMFHITKDKRYSDLKADEDQRYKSNLMDKRRPIEIRWEKKAEEMKRLHETDSASQEAHALYVWVLLMKNHPRRFRDYHLLSVDGDNVSSNFYDSVDGTITFNVFKTVNSKTGGERVIVLEEEVRQELDRYIEKFSIEDKLFPVKPERIRYLMKTHGIPLCNVNRKFQETRDIQEGKSHYETARKFNHSIGTQMTYYVKIGSPQEEEKKD
jgi:hypothetical protein